MGLEIEPRFPAKPLRRKSVPNLGRSWGESSLQPFGCKLVRLQLGQIQVASTAIHLHLLHGHRPRSRPDQIQNPNSKGPFGFWISDFGFRILDFGVRILDLGFWILDFGFRILDFGFWISDFGIWILDQFSLRSFCGGPKRPRLDFGFRILDFGVRILDLGFWILDFGFRILDFGFWISDFGIWISDFGFWISLVFVLFVAAPNGPVCILDFGFRISDFGFWILDFGFWNLDFGFWILDQFSLRSFCGGPKRPRLHFGFWISDFGFWILDFGFRILDFGFWILDFGFWILDFGFRISDFGFWILDFGLRILDFGLWILDFGFWILDFGLGLGSIDTVWILHKIFPNHADSGRRIIIIDIHSLCRIFPQDLPIDSKEWFLAHSNPLENIWSYTCRFIVCHVGPPQRLCDPCVVTLCITAMTEHRSWHSGPPGRLRLERGQSQKLRNPYMFLSKWLNLVGKSLILQAIILRGALCWNVNFEGDWRGRFSDLIWGLGLSPFGSWTKCSMACTGLESLVPRTFGLTFCCLINGFPIFEQ